MLRSLYVASSSAYNCLLPNSCVLVAHLLQSVSQHWHIITNPQPQLALELALGIVYSAGLKKCVIPCSVVTQ